MNRLYFGDGLDGRMDSLGSLDGYVRNHLTSRIDKMEEERLTAPGRRYQRRSSQSSQPATGPHT